MNERGDGPPAHLSAHITDVVEARRLKLLRESHEQRSFSEPLALRGQRVHDVAFEAG